jgi:hypothetical protein
MNGDGERQDRRQRRPACRASQTLVADQDGESQDQHAGEGIGHDLAGKPGQAAGQQQQARNRHQRGFGRARQKAPQRFIEHIGDEGRLQQRHGPEAVSEPACDRDQRIAGSAVDRHLPDEGQLQVIDAIVIDQRKAVPDRRRQQYQGGGGDGENGTERCRDAGAEG